MPSLELVQTSIERYFAALSALDADAYVAAFAPGAVLHDPVGAPPHTTPEALRAFVGSLAGMLASVTIAADSLFVAGNEAAAKWTARGTAHSGQSITLEGIDTFVLDDEGLITSARGYWHPQELGAQLQSPTNQ